MVTAVVCVVLAAILLTNPATDDSKVGSYCDYGIITYLEPVKDTKIVVPQIRLRINIPGREESFLPNAEERISYEGTEFASLEEGDLVEIYLHTEKMEKAELVAATEVLDIDQDKKQVWIEVSKEQAETFLENYFTLIEVIPVELSEFEEGEETIERMGQRNGILSEAKLSSVKLTGR